MGAADFVSERELLGRLREALSAEASTSAWKRFEELIELLDEPRCAESQADGAPCPDAACDCEACGRALAWVRRLRRQLARSAS